jgi:hypothetical protein
MDELLKTAVTQVPGLVVLAVIVRFFLKYLSKRDELTRDMNHVIEKNTEAVSHNTAIMEQLKDFLARPH